MSCVLPKLTSQATFSLLPAPRYIEQTSDFANFPAGGSNRICINFPRGSPRFLAYFPPSDNSVTPLLFTFEISREHAPRNRSNVLIPEQRSPSNPSRNYRILRYHPAGLFSSLFYHTGPDFEHRVTSHKLSNAITPARRRVSSAPEYRDPLVCRAQTRTVVKNVVHVCRYRPRTSPIECLLKFANEKTCREYTCSLAFQKGELHDKFERSLTRVPE